MGVKGFIQFLRKEFPQCFASTGHLRCLKFDEVFIDINPILHRKARQQVNDISQKELNHLIKLFSESPFSIENADISINNNCPNNYNNLQPRLPFTKDQMDAFNRIPFFCYLYQDIISILYRYLPQKKVYVSIDGAAPVAKLKVQRERRNENTANYQKKMSLNSGLFNTRRFTPGNLFMGLVDRNLLYIMQDYLLGRKDKLNDNFVTKVDSTNRGGETDAKILSEIYSSYESDRSFNSSVSQLGQNEWTSRIICSSDSDSVLQAIATGLPRFYAVDPFLSPNYTLSLFSGDAFMAILKSIDPVHYISLKNDLVFISLFKGNDYFPSIRHAPLSFLWQHYLAFRKNRLSSCSGNIEEVQLIDVSTRSLNLKVLKDCLTEFIPKLESYYKPEKQKESADASDLEDLPMNSDRLKNTNGPSTSAESLLSHFQMMLWSLSFLFTGRCSNALKYLECSREGDQNTAASSWNEISVYDIAAMDLPCSGRLTLDPPFPLDQHFIPLASSILLFDHHPEYKTILPKAAHDLYDEYHTDARFKSQSDLQNLMNLTSRVASLPLNEFTLFEADTSFPKDELSYLRLNSTQASSNSVDPSSHSSDYKEPSLKSLFDNVSIPSLLPHNLSTSGSNTYLSVSLHGRNFTGLAPTGHPSSLSEIPPSMSPYLIKNEAVSIPGSTQLNWNRNIPREQYDPNKDCSLYGLIFRKTP